MKVAIISDHNVEKLHGSQVQKLFPDSTLFSFPPGEIYKTRKTKERLEDHLLAKGFSRDTLIVALGGGVVTDLVGFLASTFCRGVPLILMPTTVLGMVDAAIGGKNGVNTDRGKNMIGTIYAPQAIFWNFDFLKTLPEKEIWNGKVEMIKHGLIADADFFRALPMMGLREAIIHAAEIKRRIVASDPFDKNLRLSLNFGHTIGHAIETLSDYRISHGEAVALGIAAESQISHELGILDGASLAAIEACFPGEIPFSAEEIIPILSVDKKARGGVPYFVLLETIGKVHGCAPVPPKVLKHVLQTRCGSQRV